MSVFYLVCPLPCLCTTASVFHLFCVPMCVPNYFNSTMSIFQFFLCPNVYSTLFVLHHACIPPNPCSAMFPTLSVLQCVFHIICTPLCLYSSQSEFRCVFHLIGSPPCDRLGGLVVKASASGTEDPGFESRLRRDFSGSSHTSELKIGTPVTTLPGAWHFRVSAGTGRPGVSIL